MKLSAHQWSVYWLGLPDLIIPELLDQRIQNHNIYPRQSLCVCEKKTFILMSSAHLLSSDLLSFLKFLKLVWYYVSVCFRVETIWWRWDRDKTITSWEIVSRTVWFWMVHHWSGIQDVQERPGEVKQWMLETGAEVSNRVLQSKPKKTRQPIPRELTLLAQQVDTRWTQSHGF